MLKDFTDKWAKLIERKRLRTGLTVYSVSKKLDLSGFVIRRAEIEPVRVRLCDLMAILNFYGLNRDEEFELCTLPLGLKNRGRAPPCQG